MLGRQLTLPTKMYYSNCSDNNVNICINSLILVTIIVIILRTAVTIK